jgi:hypothetical protein
MIWISPSGSAPLSYRSLCPVMVCLIWSAVPMVYLWNSLAGVLGPLQCHSAVRCKQTRSAEVATILVIEDFYVKHRSSQPGFRTCDSQFNIQNRCAST